MRGLLADVNVQGHLRYVRRLLDTLDLWTILAELNLDLVTFRDLNLCATISMTVLSGITVSAVDGSCSPRIETVMAATHWRQRLQIPGESVTFLS